MIGVAHGKHATFTKGLNVLGGLEAKRTEIADGANAAPLVFRAWGLGAVFDDHETMLLGQGNQRIHVGGQPVKVDGHDELRPR